jgi:uncharacterized protein YlxP (DUF503 family)
MPLVVAIGLPGSITCNVPTTSPAQWRAYSFDSSNYFYFRVSHGLCSFSRIGLYSTPQQRYINSRCTCTAMSATLSGNMSQSLLNAEERRTPRPRNEPPRDHEQTMESNQHRESSQRRDEELVAREIASNKALTEKLESAGKLADKVQKTQYSAWVADVLQEERVSGALDSRSQQAMLQIALTEQRIREVEQKLQAVMQYVYEEPPTWTAKKAQRHSVFKHVIRRTAAAGFSLSHTSFEVPVHERPALEVLVKEELIGTQADIGVPAQAPIQSGPYSPGVSSPERLRIRFRPLLTHLQRVAKVYVSSDLEAQVDDDAKEAPSIVFLRPFKLLIIHERKIRDSVQELELLLEQESADSTNMQISGTARAKPVDQEFDNKDLLQDLKLLIEFFDMDLKPTFDLRRSIRDGTAREIEYQDLWHLFDKGAIVIASSDRSQAYRVVNYVGGREPLVDRLGYELNLNEKVQPVEGFVVECLSLIFDGSRYVPRVEKFRIRRFLGRHPITSLSVYPLVLDPNSGDLRRDLLVQGQRYLELTVPPFSHRAMTGKTLDEPSHDVDAQIIVDMTLAFNSMPNLRPASYATEDQWTKPDERETQIPAYCHETKMHPVYSEGHCGSDIAFKDLQMDQTELSSYLQENAKLLGPRQAAELTEEDQMLLPNWVFGFVLRSRQWVKVDTKDLSPVSFDNNLDDLLLHGRHKDTIQALVKTHENTRTSSRNGLSAVGTGIDLVKGKGTGLILLLHGEPGR